MSSDPYMMMYFLGEPLQAPCKTRMDSTLWMRLPADLVERVLLFLPTAAQARLQLVCKAWDSLLRSSRFQERTTSVALACRQSSLCYVVPHFLINYARPPRFYLDLHHVRVDLSFVPAKFLSSSLPTLPKSLGGTSSALYLRADDGVGEGTYGVCFCVADLAKRTCVELPPLTVTQASRPEFPGYGDVVVEELSGCFQITVLWLNTTTLVARYSSSAGAWTIRNLHDGRNRVVESWMCASVMCEDGSVYLVSDPHSGGPILLLCNRNGRWVSEQQVCGASTVAVDNMLGAFPDAVTWDQDLRVVYGTDTFDCEMDWYLFEHDGRLLFIRADKFWQEGGRHGRVSIWALEKSHPQVPVVKPYWLSGMVSGNSVLLDAQLASDTVLLCFDAQRVGEHQLFAFHLRHNTWHHLTPSRESRDSFNTELQGGVPASSSSHSPLPYRTTRYKGRNGKETEVRTFSRKEWLDCHKNRLRQLEMLQKNTRDQLHGHAFKGYREMRALEMTLEDSLEEEEKIKNLLESVGCDAD